MTLYYIYSNKDNTGKVVEHLLVEEVEPFAQHVFNPYTMEFCGVSIEAPDPESALQAFKQPNETSLMTYCCEEPEATLLKRSTLQSINGDIENVKENLDKARKQLAALAAQILVTKIARNLLDLNVNVSSLAEQVRTATTDSPLVTSQSLYDRLIQKYVEQLQRLGYKRGSDYKGA